MMANVKRDIQFLRVLAFNVDSRFVNSGQCFYLFSSMKKEHAKTRIRVRMYFQLAFYMPMPMIDSTEKNPMRLGETATIGMSFSTAWHLQGKPFLVTDQLRFFFAITLEVYKALSSFIISVTSVTCHANLFSKCFLFDRQGSS